MPMTVSADCLDARVSRRWWALASVAVAQLMLGIDASIMNIALPSAQAALGMSDLARQWVITAYLLGYGGLLLLGGRVVELLGRRRSLLVGLVGFITASVAGGLAVTPGMLVATRGLQGVFGALMTPAALALLSGTFPDGRDRARAYGIYGTIMGSGVGIGVLLGGVLTVSLSWRAVLLVNVPIAAFSMLAALYAFANAPTVRRRLDVAGAVLGSAGLGTLVYGLSTGAAAGWRSPLTIGVLVAAVVLLTAFLRREARTDTPLLPLRLFRNRTRTAAYVAMFSWGIATLSAFLFLSYTLQGVLGYSAFITGLCFLPYPAIIQVGVRLTRRLPSTASVSWLFGGGLTSMSAGLFLLAQLDVGSGYLGGVLPIFVFLGLGTALVLPTANNVIAFGAGPDTGVAAATGVTAQQIGGSLGTAVLGAIAAVTTAELAGSTEQVGGGPAAALAGYTTASLIGSAALATAALLVVLIAGRRATNPSTQGERE